MSFLPTFDPSALLAQYGMVALKYLTIVVVAMGVGAYSMNKWNAGDLQKKETKIVWLQGELRTANGNVGRLEAGISERNARIKADGTAHDARLKLAEQNEAAAKKRADAARATVQALLSARPVEGQDTILSGLDLVLRSIP